jgi:hypothetical protein
MAGFSARESSNTSTMGRGVWKQVSFLTTAYGFHTYSFFYGIPLLFLLCFERRPENRRKQILMVHCPTKITWIESVVSMY